MAKRIREFLREEHNLEVIRQLQDHGVHWQDTDPTLVAEAGQFTGKTFVITGTLPGITRDEAKALIQKEWRQSHRYRVQQDQLSVGR